MLNWILDDCGYQPGFLIGGVPGNFDVSARLGESMFFVVEADEYDCAFFDKRSKFVHYQPRTLILNNLEFDHADIFDDLAAIQRQFHHLIRTVPSEGRILAPVDDANISETLAKGLWSEIEFSGNTGTWSAKKLVEDGSVFDVYFQGEKQGQVSWHLVGDHNVHNALMSIAAARHVGVMPDLACESLGRFINTKRRLEHKGIFNDVEIYDDFAHHPTAIQTTLEGLRAKIGRRRLIAVLEPRSNTMKLGIHKDEIAPALDAADAVFLFQPPEISWCLDELASRCKAPAVVYDEMDALVAAISSQAQPDDVILVMSNGGFGGIFEKLPKVLMARSV